MQDFINKSISLQILKFYMNLVRFYALLKLLMNTISKFRYGLYQIDEEINIKIQTKDYNVNGEPEMAFKYGDLKYFQYGNLSL